MTDVIETYNRLEIAIVMITIFILFKLFLETTFKSIFKGYFSAKEEYEECKKENQK